MPWFDDDRLEEIYYVGVTYGVSPADCFVIRRKLLILMAMRDRISLPVVGRIFPMETDREAVQVTSDWSISYAWFSEAGPRAMRLEP